MTEAEATQAAQASEPKKAKAVKPKAPKGEKKPKVKPNHPPVAYMVISAIKELKDRNGSSVQAIKKYIQAHNTVDIEKITPFIRKYLKSGVVKGELVQAKGRGASGSFKLNKSAKGEGDKPKKVSKPKSVKPKSPKSKVPKVTKPSKSAGEKKVKMEKEKAPKAKSAAVKKDKPSTPKKTAKPTKASKPKAEKKKAASKPAKSPKKVAAKKPTSKKAKKRWFDNDNESTLTLRFIDTLTRHDLQANYLSITINMPY
ncbi:DNA binding [Dermatophagoides farinae]|uniref:DNA binding n=2 Tax=Dermatophagoides farinae TaxID=6954 RepID=A0A922I8Y4_DERFA|nr:DNA binding [Dermatophagoides farinae]